MLAGPGNLLQNGDFEDGTFSGWYVGGSLDQVSLYEYETIFGSYEGPTDGGSFGASFGTYTPGWMMQTVSLPDAPCTLAFLGFRESENVEPSDYFVAGIDDQILIIDTTFDRSWQPFTTTFDGKGRDRTLFFSYRCSSFPYNLDNVSISCASTGDGSTTSPAT